MHFLIVCLYLVRGLNQIIYQLVVVISDVQNVNGLAA